MILFCIKNQNLQSNSLQLSDKCGVKIQYLPWKYGVEIKNVIA